MGHYIETYCPTAVGIGDMLQHAAEKIKLGGIAIGELHNKPHGRAIVYDLIEMGFVTRLFIEVHDMEQLGKRIRNSDLGKPADQWEKTNDLFIFEMGMNFLDKRHEPPNPLPMLALIQTAVSKGIKVHFYDVPHETPTSNLGMQERNVAMAKVFLKYTAPTETKLKSPIGAVALVGGDHLETPVNDDIYKLSLQAACQIPHDHVFNTKRL